MAIAEELQIIVDAKVSQAVRELKKFDKTIDDAEKTSNKLINSFKALAGPVAIGAVLAGVIKIGKESERAFQIQEAAEKTLEQTIKATGSAAGLTAIELTNLASSLQEVTTYGDEAIIGAESLLLTFKDIGEDVFPRALESILDVSQAMGTGLKESSVQLGKALNDPVGGISALTRVGIQFTDAQKDLIKSFVESGETAKAQSVILDELESQFGGVARAAAQTSEGGVKQLNNSYGDLQETIGGVISGALTPYRANLKKEIDSVNATIQAHLLRKKALEGNATLLEELNLKQIEQQKAEEKLAQAKLNVANAEEHVLDTQYLSEQQILRIEAAKEEALRRSELTIMALEDEIALRKIGTREAQSALDAEQALIEANIELASGIANLTDLKTENNELGTEGIKLTNEQIEADARLRDSLMEEEAIRGRNRRLIEEEAEAQSGYNEELENYRAALEAAQVSATKLAGIGLNSIASGFEEIGKSLVDGGLQFKDFGKLALGALADVLSSLGAQLAAQAALHFFGLFPNPVSGAGALAGSAAAFTAAGIARGVAGAMPEGGSFVTSGAQTLLVGDNPGGQERVTVEPVSSNGANVSNSQGGGDMYLMIDGQKFKAWFQQGINNGKFTRSAGGRI